jgi:hypothetical protein
MENSDVAASQRVASQKQLFLRVSWSSHLRGCSDCRCGGKPDHASHAICRQLDPILTNANDRPTRDCATFIDPVSRICRIRPQQCARGPIGRTHNAYEFEFIRGESRGGWLGRRWHRLGRSNLLRSARGIKQRPRQNVFIIFRRSSYASSGPRNGIGRSGSYDWRWRDDRPWIWLPVKQSPINVA